MDAEAATAEVFESFESTPAPPPRSLKILRPEDEGNGEYMRDGSPPRASDIAEIREIVHQTNLGIASLTRTLEIQAVSKTENGNGEKRRMTWFMAAIAFITLISAGGNFIGSSGVWIGNRNRDADDIKNLKDELASLRTWNEKLRNNMAAYGWLIDHEGNVSRIEETVKPKRR